MPAGVRSYIATGGADRTIRLWDISAGNQVCCGLALTRAREFMFVRARAPLLESCSAGAGARSCYQVAEAGACSLRVRI